MAERKCDTCAHRKEQGCEKWECEYEETGYISRQAAIQEILDLPNCPDGHSDMYDKARIIGVIEEVPAADVVEVVRCRDCKHWNKNYYQDIETCFEHRNVDGTEQAMRPDDYCSYGEKRDA